MQEDRDLLDLATGVDSSDAYREWERRCNERLAFLRERCQEKTKYTGTLNSFISRVARLEEARNALRQRFAQVGAGHGEPSRRFSWTEIETAFDSRVLTGVVINANHVDPRLFLEDARDTVLEQVNINHERHACLKVNTVFNGEFVAGAQTAVKSISTRNHQLFPASDLREWYDRYVIDTILAGLDEFQERDSGWALSRILNLMVNVNKCNPMHAGCWVEIPRWIKLKRALINVHSNDNACFAWAVISALYPVVRNPNRCGSYPHYSTQLNLDGIEFPMTLKQISRFEQLNNVSVNVFTTCWRERNENKIVPLRLTNDKRDSHVNMLYLSDSRNNSNVGHFVWIKNLSRLVGSQLSKSKNMKYICDRCLHYFYSSEKLSIHSVDCEKMNDYAVVLPNGDDKWLFFRDHSRKERLPFVVYADLECVLEREEKCRDNVKRYTYQHHRAFSVGYYLCSSYDEIALSYRFHRGEDCVSWFVNELKVIAHRAKVILTKNVTMAELTLDETRNFWSATSCHICERPFELEDRRVRDHCHLTGRYRGPAHSRCNLNYRHSLVIPVFFHNLSGYDAHFIIKDMANSFEGGIDLLPLTKETYISFTKNVREGVNCGNCTKLRFVDSFKFLSTSLEKLASYLDRNKLRITRSEFSELSESDFELLTRKGVFPYEFVDSFDKLQVTELPPREAFYSSLTGETATESDYEHARNVWRCFRVENLGEYSDLYLKTDVLLLADIFENFRDTCIDTYGLDPAHYYTLPGYTWDAMLKYTGVRFELLTDIDMVMFVERGIRGGLSQCSNRYARANNKYMQSHDSSQPSTYLMYFNVNNLLGDVRTVAVR